MVEDGLPDGSWVIAGGCEPGDAGFTKATLLRPTGGFHEGPLHLGVWEQVQAVKLIREVHPIRQREKEASCQG
jgi:hypothetical protein